MNNGFDNPRDVGRKQGERRKRLALDLLEVNRADYVLLGRRALVQAAMANGTATADDVRDCVELPKGISPKMFGCIPRPLALAGIIYAVGDEVTRRPQAHARKVTIWAIRDRLKAEAWLRNNKPAAPAGTDATGNSDSPTCESEETR